MTTKRKWWPDSILGRFVVGLGLAFFTFWVIVVIVAFIAQRLISPG